MGDPGGVGHEDALLPLRMVASLQRSGPSTTDLQEEELNIFKNLNHILVFLDERKGAYKNSTAVQIHFATHCQTDYNQSDRSFYYLLLGL